MGERASSGLVNGIRDVLGSLGMGQMCSVMTGSSRSVIGSKGGLRFDEAASRRG